MLGWVSSSAGPARLAAVAFGAGALALAAAGPASAGDGSVRPNYTFPAGLKGFQLTTHGGPASPGILVGFNPQPDPPVEGITAGPDLDLLPAVRPETTLDLTNKFRPVLTNTFEGSDFTLHFWILGHGDLGPVDIPSAPNSDGLVAFRLSLIHI